MYVYVYRSSLKELCRKSIVSVVQDLWRNGSSKVPLPSYKVSDLNSLRGTRK